METEFPNDFNFLKKSKFEYKIIQGNRLYFEKTAEFIVEMHKNKHLFYTSKVGDLKLNLSTMVNKPL